MSDEPVVAVVVIGDIGRSPRMCNHALSLAHQLGYKHCGTAPYTLMFWWTARAGCPGFPLLIHSSALPIASATQPDVGEKVGGFVEWTHWLEGWSGRQAHASICVSRGMREDLQTRWRVPAAIFYDRPPQWKFKPFSVSDTHEMLVRICSSGDQAPPVLRGAPPTEAESYEDIPEYTFLTLKSSSGEVVLRPCRPLLLVSSTSWTPDEDFSILLDALVKYDEIARLSHNRTAETSLPRIVVVITGKGPDKDMYIKKINKLSLSWVDIVTAWLAAEDYPTMLAAADLGVSLHTSTSGLDLPMKVVDMFGVGLPVLAKNFPCIQELVDDKRNGILFETSHELSESILRLATGHPLHNKSLHSLREAATGCLPSWEETWQNTVAALFQPEVNEALQRILASE